ncbi:MAG: 1-deoxy-D-xylulose-5-phosphate reductoisomerase, partial [Desulfobacterales bacterium]
MKRLSILGSTGSIGRNTLAVVARFPERFAVEALAAKSNLPLLCEQITLFKPELAVVHDQHLAGELRKMLPESSRTRVLSGAEGYSEAASLPSVDMVVTAVVGAAGVVPTLAAIDAGKDVA